MIDLREIAVQKTYQIIDKANIILNIELKYPTILFNLHGCIAGKANYNGWKIHYNYTLLKENFKNFVEDTIVHEVAHLVEYAKYQKCGHKENWKGIMRQLGISDPQRCHDYNVAHCKRKTKQFIYECNCNTKHVVGNKMHGRISYDSSNFRCGHCNSMLKYSKMVWR